MSLSDFQLISRLGEGAYSSVYRVRRLTDNKEYALKKVKLINLSDKEKQNALNQVRILASIRNPNIIAYKEAFLSDSGQSLCIVMEYANNGDLFQKICDHQKNGTYFNENTIWKIFIRVVRGLKSLHQLKIMHRDLKSANVFLNQDGTAKLGDMNVSKVAKKGLLYTQTGTPYYASPQVWRDQPYDMKSDIWSLGCVLYEMITLKPPFRAQDMQGLFKKVLRGHYPKLPSHFSNDLGAIVKAMLQVSAHLRPTCGKQEMRVDRILEMASVKQRSVQLLDEGEADLENVLLKTIRVPKNMMYLTDRLPKATYQSADAINDTSHLSLPSINAKHSGTSPGLAYGVTGKSGSLSPIRGQKRKFIGKKKSIVYNSRDSPTSAKIPVNLTDKKQDEERDISVPVVRHDTRGDQETGRSEQSKRDKKNAVMVGDSGGTKDTLPQTDLRKEIDLHSPGTRGSNGSGGIKKQTIKAVAPQQEVKIKKSSIDKRDQQVTPPSPIRSPNMPRRYHQSPIMKEYQKKNAQKVAANIERIQNIYANALEGRMPNSLKKKHSLIRDVSKERIDIYNSYSIAGNVSQISGGGYRSGSRSPELSDIRLPKLPALRGQHIQQIERSPSTKALGGYKSRIASISKLHANPIDAIKDVYGSSKISLAPSITSGIRPSPESKLLIDKKSIMKVKPMSLNYRNPLPSLKPVSISPENRFQKRTASIDEPSTPLFK